MPIDHEDIDSENNDGDNDRLGSRADAEFDAHDQPLAIVSTHAELFAEAFPGHPQPVIPDAEDGLPRPDDTAIRGSVVPLRHDTFVCLEDDRTWVEVFTPEVSKTKMESLRASILHTAGHSRVILSEKYANDGAEKERRSWPRDRVKTLWGHSFVEETTEEAEAREQRDFGSVSAAARSTPPERPAPPTNAPRLILVRPVRPRCSHYSEQLSVSSEISFDGRVLPMYRFCDALRTVAGAKWATMDEAIVACSLRDPPDLISQERIVKRNRDKMLQGENREFFDILAPAADGAKTTDWKVAAETLPTGRKSIELHVQRAPGVPSTVQPKLVLAGPAVMHEVDRPFMIVLADDGWQPPDKEYTGVRFAGLDHGFLDSGHGEALVRLRVDEPPFENEDDALTWPSFSDPMLGVGLPRAAHAAAAALRQGKTVVVVGRDPRRAPSFFGALILVAAEQMAGRDVGGLDALDMISAGWVAAGDSGDVVPNLAHRVYLRRVLGAGTKSDSPGEKG